MRWSNWNHDNNKLGTAPRFFGRVVRAPKMSAAATSKRCGYLSAHRRRVQIKIKGNRQFTIYFYSNFGCARSCTHFVIYFIDMEFFRRRMDECALFGRCCRRRLIHALVFNWVLRDFIKFPLSFVDHVSMSAFDAFRKCTWIRSERQTHDRHASFHRRFLPKTTILSILAQRTGNDCFYFCVLASVVIRRLKRRISAFARGDVCNMLHRAAVDFVGWWLMGTKDEWSSFALKLFPFVGLRVNRKKKPPSILVRP